MEIITEDLQNNGGNSSEHDVRFKQMEQRLEKFFNLITDNSHRLTRLENSCIVENSTDKVNSDKVHI